jgi:hypothetical protein
MAMLLFPIKTSRWPSWPVVGRLDIQAKAVQRAHDKASCAQLMLQQRLVPQAILAFDHGTVALDHVGAFGGTVGSGTNLSEHFAPAAVVDPIFVSD